MNKYELADALARELQGTADEKDRALINEWIKSDKANEQIYASILKDEGDVLEKLRRVDTESALVRLHRRAAYEKRKRWARVAVAAAVLVTAGFFLLQRTSPKDQGKLLAEQENTVRDILPASDKAVLVLANGIRVELKEKGDTAIAYGGMQFIQEDGKLSYAQREETGAPEIQELITPNAGKYRVVLADGTGVWLNAASKLRFPDRFADHERLVELDGEGYFEVSKDAKRPFIVKTSDNSQVQVLGTVFNVKGYDKEKIRTTLLEGSVKVSKGDHSKMIRPGEMAEINPGGIKTGKGDVEAATAWRHDQFMFHQMPIGEMMEELARWYNVKIIYEGGYNQQEENYNGEIGRSVTLDKLLAMLEQTGVARFRLKERTLYVRPY